jgi:hypothetical protein
MAEPRDHYARYYADRLWALLPSVYRSDDSPALDQPGPLRELVDRIGAQAAILRRSIDRLWEDQSIESCDDWVIPYIADLLATNLVTSLDARGQRLDVAKTIYYRRRKGTLGILEEIAADVTGWEARVIEFFRRMGRARHGLDPGIGLPVGDVYPDALQAAQGLVGRHTQTAIGGCADVRHRYGASRAHTAFDEFYHYADFRRGRGTVGWHNIPRLGVFLWRLKSIGVDHTVPVPVQGCPGQYSFDPAGRQIPLFAAPSHLQTRAFGDVWVSPEEWQLPSPIDQALWVAERARLYPDSDEAIRSLGVYTLPGVTGYVLVAPDNVEVFPEVGRFRFQAVDPPVSDPVFCVYHSGFPSLIGAGGYDRRLFTPNTPLPQPETTVSGGGAIVPATTGTTTIGDSLTYVAANVNGISDACIQARNEKRPLIRLGGAASPWVLAGNPDAALLLDGLCVTNSDIILHGQFASVTLRSVTLDPGTSGAPAALFETAVDGRPLVPTRLWVEGKVRSLTVERSILGPIRVRHGGVIGALSVRDSIVQSIRSVPLGVLEPAHVRDTMRFALRLRNRREPVAGFLHDALPAPVQVELAAYTGSEPPEAALLRALVDGINPLLQGPSIYTPARFAGVLLAPDTMALLAANPAGPEVLRLNRMLLEDAMPLELGELAIALDDGTVSLSRVTVLGRLHVHRLEASEAILNDVAFVENTQDGCVRLSAWSTGSLLPRRYESVETRPRTPLFASRSFGRPDYGQLLATADQAIVSPPDGSIREGAQNGSEMGAYNLELNAIKERSLLTKYEEYTPLGLIPVVIYVT